jgi:hypothetical protein
MKASHTALARSLLLSSALCVAACVPAPDSTPAPSPTPTTQASPPAPAPSAAPPPAPASAIKFEDWIDEPQTPGEWVFDDEPAEAIAIYRDDAWTPLFFMRCEKATKSIELARTSTSTTPLVMQIRTEKMDRALETRPVESPPLTVATLRPGDRLLDAMALTRGRFAVETSGMPALYLPPWAEVTRVIEACR